MLLQRRNYACHRRGSWLWTNCTRASACGTLIHPCTRLRCLGCSVPLVRISPPCKINLLVKLRSDFALADTDRSGAIDFDEFLEFVGGAESEASRAIKGSLLGVRA